MESLKQPDPAEGTDHQQYLTFVLGGETFAIGIMGINFIIEFGHLTEVPMMPPFVRGVINLRGSVVPVLDLAVRFGKGHSQVTRRTCIVIVEVCSETERQVVGMIVDAVNEVLEIPRERIEPPPAFGTRIRSEFIQGMGNLNERFLIILDVHHVLSIEELALLDAVDGGERLLTTA